MSLGDLCRLEVSTFQCPTAAEAAGTDEKGASTAKAKKIVEDEEIECIDCSTVFQFTVEEQDFYKVKGFRKKLAWKSRDGNNVKPNGSNGGFRGGGGGGGCGGGHGHDFTPMRSSGLGPRKE